MRLQGSHRELVRRLLSCGVGLCTLSMYVACGGATEGTSRGPLSAADSGPDSVANTGGAPSGGHAGASGSSGTLSSGGVSGVGAVAGSSGAPETDGRACVGHGLACSTGSECCSGNCTSLHVAPDGGPTGGTGFACQERGCKHFGESCSVGSDCCLGGVRIDCISGVCGERGH
jgi:hypothetical protein